MKNILGKLNLQYFCKKNKKWMEAFVIFLATESCKNSSYFMQHKKMFFGENKVIDPEYSEY